MTEEELSRLIDGVDGLDAASLSDFEGVVRAECGDFEAEVVSAVAALSHAQVVELGRQMGAGEPTEWFVATAGLNLYARTTEDGELLAAVGKPDGKPAKVAARLERAISRTG